MSEKHLSLKQYRNIDLVLLMAVTLVFEGIIFYASTKWFASQLYTVSVVPAMTAVCLMRWGWRGVYVAAWGGFVGCILGNGEASQYVIYMVGNCLAAASLFAFRRGGKEKIARKTIFGMLFGVLVAFLMQAGRALVSLLFGVGAEGALLFVTTDSLTVVFTAFLVFVARKQDGLFEDQETYVRRINTPAEQDGYEGRPESLDGGDEVFRDEE